MGADAQRKEGERKSARRGRDLRDAAVPGLRETRLRARAEEATSPLGHASDCGRKAAARPVGRQARTADPRSSRGCLVLPGSAVHTRSVRVPGSPTMHPGSVAAAGGLEGVPGSGTVLPGASE